MEKYKPRIVDRLLQRKLSAAGGVVIQGPKWCGKTTTAARQASSAIYMTEQANIQLARVAPQVALDGETPRLVDEWQVVPQLWDAARHQIDLRNQAAQFIFTGSAVPADKSQILHSGTGRFSWLTMRTMSLYESGESTGKVSLTDLFNGANIEPSGSETTIEQLAYWICRGGWPAIIDLPDTGLAPDRARDYVDAVVASDISRADGVTRSSMRTMRLLRSLARHQGQSVSLSGLRNDILQNDSDTLSTDTISSYLSALSGIFVTEDSLAWNPNLRSKTAIRQADTRYFSDPSIATAVLGIGPNDLIADLNTMGLFFETLAVRDLRTYSASLDGQVYHYRDKTGLECDAVVHLRNGRYGLVEIKLGGETLEETGAQTLKKLASRLDSARMPQPSFLMVLTGVGRYAYRRDDNVWIVPISTLKD